MLYGNTQQNSNNKDDDDNNNSIQVFTVYVLSQQIQGQHSADTGNHIMEQTQHKVKDKLQASRKIH
jgi:hypothetical protein